MIYFHFYSTQQVNINPSYQPLELKYALNKVGIKTLVAAESFKNLDYFSILNEAVPEIKETKEMDFIKSREVPTLESVIMISDRIEKYEGLNIANFCKRILIGFLKNSHVAKLAFNRGTWRFQDIMQMGGNNELKEIGGIQSKIQFDEPANIQFTSVSLNQITAEYFMKIIGFFRVLRGVLKELP